MRRLVLSLFFFVFMSHTVFAEVSVKAYCKFTLVRAALYWTCPCNRNGEFWVDIEGDPENREEWNIEAPAYKWESASFTFNPDDQAIVYYALQPADYGNPHTVTVTVKWNMTHKLTGEKKTVTKKAQLQLDAVELGELTVRQGGSLKLLDGKVGIATLPVRGTSPETTKELAKKVTIKSETVEKAGIVNKLGTVINFTPRVNSPLDWDTSPLYWYGVVTSDKIECCWDKPHEYKFTVTLDSNCVTSKGCVVYMDSHGSQFGFFYPNLSKARVATKHGTEWQSRLLLHDSSKKSLIKNIPDNNQYRPNIIVEENYHEQQWLTLGPEDGGTGVAWTTVALAWVLEEYVRAGRIKKDAKGFYAVGVTKKEAEDKARAAIDDAKQSEEVYFKQWREENLPFIELKAKIKADYNAAFKYHCTYERSTKVLEKDVARTLHRAENKKGIVP